MREHQAGRPRPDDSDLGVFHFFSATRFSVRHAPLSRVGRAYCRKAERHKRGRKWRASGKQHLTGARFTFFSATLRCRASGERVASKANGVRSASRARGRGSLKRRRQWSAFFNRYSALCLSSRDTSRSEAELRSSFYGAVCADSLATGSTGEPYGRAHSERSERLYEACPVRLRSALAFGLGPYSQESVFTKVVESEGQVI
jgi:hypothetical protein